MPTGTQTPVSAKRSAAARKNGANGKGPKSAEGKAKSSQNALKHGFSAAKWLALPEDEKGAYEAFREELLEEMAAEGAMQRAYANQIVDNLWRLRRIITMEADLVSHRENQDPTKTYEFVRWTGPTGGAVALGFVSRKSPKNLWKPAIVPPFQGLI